METNKIILTFPNTLKRITGNSYGHNIYKNQVKENIKDGIINEIIFPDNITGISISFIRGFMAEQLMQYGKVEIFNHFKFTSKHKNVEESIIESINF